MSSIQIGLAFTHILKNFITVFVYGSESGISRIHGLLKVFCIFCKK